MARTLLRVGACCPILRASWIGVAWTQSPLPIAAQQTGAQGFKLEQIDALVAPIALYPDPLLTQILMASTFPFQVVQAGRWVEDPAHKSLSGQTLTKSLG